jgi:rSAM/selenodomain-associated transferase 1
VKQNRILGVFAKQPIAGQVKTRLSAVFGSEFAAKVAEAFLEDTLDRVAATSADRLVVFAPVQTREYFQQVARGRFELLAQSDGDLGQRLYSYFHHAREQGYTRIVAIGTDSPTMPIEYVEQAFARLADHDAVIGPATDGGYYLIGTGARELPVFDRIPWSTPRVLEETVRRLGQANVAALPPWYDIDTPDDWAMLRGHILAMRQAGIDPGVPRVERLILEQSA